MSLFHAPTRRQIDAALTVLRVVLGVTFILHGGQKLFVYGFDGVTGAFGQMGIPAPAFFGPFVAFVEFFGGIAITLGLLTRLAALGVGATMVVAILTAQLKNVHGVGDLFGLLELVYLIVFVWLAIAGPGALSIDHLIARRRRTNVPSSRSGDPAAVAA